MKLLDGVIFAEQWQDHVTPSGKAVQRKRRASGKGYHYREGRGYADGSSAQERLDSGFPMNILDHFNKVTAGPGDLREMLKEINDPTTRLIAADRLEDLGRSEESAMLRDPKHPLVTVGGGVFYAPGITGHHANPHMLAVSPDWTQSSQVQPYTMTLAGPANKGKSIVHTFVHEKPGDSVDSQNPVNLLMDRLVRHSMHAEATEHMALSDKDEEVLRGLFATQSVHDVGSSRAMLSQHTPDLGQYAGRTSVYSVADQRYWNAVPDNAIVPQLRARGVVQRAERGLGLTRLQMQAVGYDPEGSWPRTPELERAGWLYSGTHSLWMAPSMRHLDHFLRHAHPSALAGQ